MENEGNSSIWWFESLNLEEFSEHESLHGFRLPTTTGPLQHYEIPVAPIARPDEWKLALQEWVGDEIASCWVELGKLRTGRARSRVLVSVAADGGPLWTGSHRIPRKERDELRDDERLAMALAAGTQIRAALRRGGVTTLRNSAEWLRRGQRIRQKLSNLCSILSRRAQDQWYLPALVQELSSRASTAHTVALHEAECAESPLLSGDRVRARQTAVRFWVAQCINATLGVLAVLFFALFVHWDAATELALLCDTAHLQVVRAIAWVLSDHPMGIKLNHDLNHWMGTVYYAVSSEWGKHAGRFLADYSGLLWRVVGMSGLLGISTLVAAAHDAAAVLFLDVRLLYHISWRLLHHHGVALSYFLRVFRGLSVVAVGRATQPWELSNEVAVLAMLVFVPLVLLLPNTFVYAALFGTFRLALLLLGWVARLVQMLMGSLCSTLSSRLGRNRPCALVVKSDSDPLHLMMEPSVSDSA